MCLSYIYAWTKNIDKDKRTKNTDTGTMYADTGTKYADIEIKNTYT